MTKVRLGVHSLRMQTEEHENRGASIPVEEKLCLVHKKLQSTPDNSNLQEKSKKVRVIGSSKKIAERKVKTVFTAQ